MDVEVQSKERPGNLAFVISFVVFSALVLSQITSETKFSSRGPLFAQPRFWPAVGLTGMVGFGVAYLATHWRKHSAGWLREVLSWVRAIEYFVWFMIYVAAVPIIGYLGATVCFTVLLALRQGYRDWRRITISALLGVAIVLLFKTGLGVKIPGGAVYEFLPSALRNFMIVNF